MITQKKPSLKPSPFIRSFGRQKARKLRTTTQEAYETRFPLVKLDLIKPFFKETFPEMWLEIGFGGGEHLLQQLERNPSVAIIGCEPFLNGVAKLLTHLNPEDEGRIRLWQGDVRYLLESIPPASFSRIFILFPDPWPKKRHNHRRLITKEFLEKLHPVLKTGGHLYVASDDAPYVEQIQEVLYHNPKLSLIEGPPSADPTTWSARPDGWPSTRYEQKAIAQGKRCAYMVFQKLK